MLKRIGSREIRTVKRYFLADESGRGLHYIGGNVYWRLPTTDEAMENFTSFSRRKDAAAFAIERKVWYHSIGVLTLTTEIDLKCRPVV